MNACKSFACYHIRPTLESKIRVVCALTYIVFAQSLTGAFSPTNCDRGTSGQTVCTIFFIANGDKPDWQSMSFCSPLQDIDVVSRARVVAVNGWFGVVRGILLSATTSQEYLVWGVCRPITGANSHLTFQLVCKFIPFCRAIWCYSVSYLSLLFSYHFFIIIIRRSYLILLFSIRIECDNQNSFLD